MRVGQRSFGDMGQGCNLRAFTAALVHEFDDAPRVDLRRAYAGQAFTTMSDAGSLPRVSMISFAWVAIMS